MRRTIKHDPTRPNEKHDQTFVGGGASWPANEGALFRIRGWRCNLRGVH
jgi:hypothetical protein